MTSRGRDKRSAQPDRHVSKRDKKVPPFLSVDPEKSTVGSLLNESQYH